jgi:hypothetical protein
MPDPTTTDLDLIRVDILRAARRLSGRRARLARAGRLTLLAGAGAGLLTGGAFASGLLGGDAPPAVERDLAAVDAGLPADLRLNPDVVNAHAVASTGASTVYYAALAGGGYCAELVTEGAHRRGAVCTTAAGDGPIGVTIPFTDPVKPTSPVTVSGHVADPDATRIELRYPDGATDSVALGLSGFYVRDVPAEHLAAVHEHGLLLVARDASGAEVASTVVPTDGVTPTPPGGDRAPFEVTTRVGDGDLTTVLAVEGRVPAGAASVELVLDGGARHQAAVHGDRFSLPLAPEERTAMRRPATLTARAEDGRALARQVVAAPSFWIARERAGDDGTGYCYATPARDRVCKDG